MTSLKNFDQVAHPRFGILIYLNLICRVHVVANTTVLLLFHDRPKKICGLLLTDLRKPPLHALDLAYIDVSLAINFCPAVLVFPVTCKQYGLSSFA